MELRWAPLGGMEKNGTFEKIEYGKALGKDLHQNEALHPRRVCDE